MTRRELQRRLQREGIRPSAYDLDSTERDEAYSLDRSRVGWLVYYRERGIHREEHLFSSEDDACHFLLDWILRDPSTREIQGN